MGKTVAICQSCYLPWKGYFDLIAGADEFILLDDVQYTRRDWRNRNLIKTRDGLRWLTVPVTVKGRFHQKIHDVVVSDRRWRRRHLAALRHAYARAPHFAATYTFLEELYDGCGFERLSRINHRFLAALCRRLDIPTRLSWSVDYCATGDRNERLLTLCRQAGATTYLSGPAARIYLDVDLFARHGISVRWMDYEGYREYPQLHAPFEHHVSIVDLLFNSGPDAVSYLRAGALVARIGATA